MSKVKPDINTAAVAAAIEAAVGVKAITSFQAKASQVVAQPNKDRRRMAALRIPPLTAPLPDWLPEGAAAYVNFADGLYWVDGAPASVEDMLESDAENGTPFDPTAIIPGTGYVSKADGMLLGGAFKGALLVGMLGGCSGVIRFTRESGLPPETGVVFEFYSSPSWASDYVVKSNGTETALIDYGATGTSDNSLSASAIGANALAFTLLSGERMALSHNGSSAVSIPATLTDPLTSAYFMMSNIVGLAVQSITLYPPKPDGDLPTLSALS